MNPIRLSDRNTTALLLLCTTLLLSVSGALSRIDNVIYDTAQKHTHRQLPDDIALVTIDEQSLARLGRWPWSRRQHARLIDRLHADGAKVIGLDIMFAEPDATDPEADTLLSQSIARAGNVVLPVVIEKVRRNGQLIETLPLPILATKAAALGRVHAELDADAIARSITLQEGLGQAVWPHFAQALLALSIQKPEQAAATLLEPTADMAVLVKRDQRYINFYTANQHLPSLSYEQVLLGDFSAGTFTDKLVLVGATASGMADSLPTPISGFQQPMPGVEFLANALISMRDKTLITISPPWLSAMLACVLAVMPLAWLPYMRARASLWFTVFFAAVVLLVIMAIPVYAHDWTPMSAGVLGILSSYPLWMRLKLDSATKFLDAELLRLHRELTNSGSQAPWQAELVNRYATDPFQHRIEQVRTATQQLQQLEESRRETLAFISHDIRVPLASAAAQIRQEMGDQHPAHKQVAKALAWTESFLQTSRAQMLRSHEFSEFDVIGLLHEVIDEIFPLAQAQSVALKANLPNESIWINGHAETLSRAVLNLLGNALKFSPPQGVIGLGVHIEQSQIRIEITDQGPGIPAPELQQLFKRFSRLDQHTATHPGTGLGLYFAKTVMDKHQGEVNVQSHPGATTFTLVLPIHDPTQNTHH